MRRVLILGSPGAGKSTLAVELSRRTGLPLHHMDRLYWRSGWMEPAYDDWVPGLEKVLHQQEWILDGTYGNTLNLRLTHADTVILLDYPTRICLFRAVLRILQGWGRDRPDLTEGCPERLDGAFLMYVLRFRRHKRAGILQKLQNFSGTVLQFRHPSELKEWLAHQPIR